MAVYVLTDEEVQGVLERHPEISADIIPTYGLRITDNERDLLVALTREGQIKMVDLTYIDPETGQRVTMTEARIKSILFDLWGGYDPWGKGIAKWLSDVKAPELITGVLVLIVALQVVQALAIFRKK